MISLGWNCWGLGNLRTVRVLGELVQRWNPNIIFLSETKIKKKAMEKIMEKINFGNGLIVPRKGRGGGLALLWKREVDLEIMGYSRNHIDAIVSDQSQVLGGELLVSTGIRKRTEGRILGMSL